MYNILKNTPFGFMIELENELCYDEDREYEIYINDCFYLTSNKNVISMFGLKSNTDYKVEIKGLSNDILINMKTEKLDYLINVLDFNAKGDGANNDTSAVNAAVYSAPPHSTVYFPKGAYLVNQILLKSNVNLYLEKGAVIKQNTNREDLAVLKGFQKNYEHTAAIINASWEGHPLDCYCSLIYGKYVENIHIYGEGALDGNGFEGDWWLNPKVKNVAYRPKNVFVAYCNNITISGLTSQNSASWNIHPFYCDNVNFYCLYIKSVDDSPNTDGINPESCEDVQIVGCHFSVGDDCITLKSGKYFMSQAYYKKTKNVTIRNCFMQKGHGGVVFGSEMSCGVENVLVTQCLFQDTDRGLRFKSRRGRGNRAVVDGVKVFNVKMERVVHCFVVNMFYNCDPDGKSDYVKNKNITVKDNETPSISNIEISNLVSSDISGSGVFIYGLPESKVENILIENSSFHFANERVNECPAMMDDYEVIENLGIFIKNGVGINIRNNHFTGEYTNVIDEE